MKTFSSLSSLFVICLSVLIMTSCKDEDECDGILCENGGIRVEGTCDCPDGFSGIHCEIEDLCITQQVDCQNGGTCTDGICDCPDGFVGTNCEKLDPTLTQAFLDEGKTPLELFNGGIILDSLYGKRYAGGLIFYLNTVDGTGLVAATEDQGMDIEWGCLGLYVPFAINVSECAEDCTQPEPEETFEGARIGDGVVNTQSILDKMCTSESGGDIAAALCRDLGEDWFLPSRGELNMLYTNLHQRGLGKLANTVYWSSTQHNADRAWIQFFPNGYQFSDGKAADCRVRAVREF